MNLRMTTSPKNASLLNLQRICLILIISLFSVTGIYAQSVHEITGTVTSLGEPLAGASVIEAGTTNGTMTDLDGKFSLTVKDNAKIEISFIGFKPKTVTVGTETVFNIELEEEINLLNEVVAIGYGVQKKKLNTGATIQVKGDELAKMNTTNALQALQGKTPGVQITSTSGQPGESLKVRIRGLGTVADASPLFVVDGILTNDITYLNNSDIESIDVLKD
ncbi:MAG: carboxypeptidase-like regulatory domain-containing protein, partial [Prevotella sp.]|nr:carboxypeptidase-like regulatory domain-containing protein [Prevotella sp.]